MGELLFLWVKNSFSQAWVWLDKKHYEYLFGITFWFFLKTIATTILCFANCKGNLQWMKAKNMPLFLPSWTWESLKLFHSLTHSPMYSINIWPLLSIHGCKGIAVWDTYSSFGLNEFKVEPDAQYIMGTYHIIVECIDDFVRTDVC